MNNVTLLLLAVALMGCREVQPQQEPSEVLTPAVLPASASPEAGGSVEGTADGVPDTFPFALATSRRIRIELDSYLEAIERQVAYEEWLEAQEVATVVVTQARTYATPTATAIATPIPTIYVQPQASNGSLRAAIEASAWPAEQWDRLERVVMCESRGQTTAQNGVHYGALQANVNLWGYPPADLVGQLNHGLGIWMVQGWQAWSCK